MPRAGPRKVQRYSLEFKLKAVKLSQLPGVKEARDGVLRGRVAVPKAVKVPPASQVKRLQVLQRKYALLEEEHALLKKLIRFTSARKPTSSRSSKKNGNGSV
jgi:transposase